ncbi:MAG: alpha-E domain-containing protein [Myxococcota bacterium]
MLSRVAERMYWAGRYLERAENTSRLINIYATMLLDLPAETGIRWDHLLHIFGAEEPFRQTKSKRSEQTVMKFLIADPDNPASILSSLRAARENVRTSRDIVPTEGWECVNELYLMGSKQLKRAATGRRRRFDTLSSVIQRCQQITGLLSGTMSHGQAYNFLRIGNFLERADMTSRVVDVAASTLAPETPAIKHYENTLWMAVLRSLSAYQMYRRYMRRRVASADVVAFLWCDPDFPRAVRRVLDVLSSSLERLPHPEEPVRVVQELRSDVEIDREAPMDWANLHDRIDRFQVDLGRLHAAIEQEWFLKEAEPPA